MSNQNKQPQSDDFMNFLQHMFGAQEQMQGQTADGFAIYTPFGDTLIEVIDQQVQVSVNDKKVVGLDFDVSSQTITVQAFDYQSPSNDCAYEQVIQLGSDNDYRYTHGHETDLRTFIQQLQDDKMFITLDVATNPQQDAYILAKKLDNLSGKDSFQVWRIPNKGSAGMMVYDEALYTDAASTLDAGLELFSRVCRKTFTK